MIGARRGLFLLALGALLASGCSDSESPEAEGAPVLSVFETGRAGQDDDGVVRRIPGDDADADPVVESLRFEPADPVSRGRIRAMAEISGSWTSLEYQWDVNGEPLAANAAEVVLPVIAKGDAVTVRVVPVRGTRRGEARSWSVRVRNQPPILQGLSIERATLDPFEAESDEAREMWRAAVRAEDPDGDEVEIQHRWFVNGRLSEIDGELFPVDRLVRDDRVEVEVRAFDGRVWSPPARSGEVTVGNSPPTIVSRPPRPDATGRFRYQVEVEDPDGDRSFRYALREGPQGMQIDELGGVVSWRPDSDQAGRHTVEIVVTDEGGAEASQSFSIALVARTEDGPGPAAAR